MSVQVKRRRDTAANLATFTGAQGELLVDTTNNRLQVHDGATAGGWPAALETRTAVSDAAYSALVTDRLIAYTALTAARVVTLPAASSYPSGARLTIVDESGACSSTKTITVARAGSDAIAGATSLVLSAAYAALEIESNGSNAWAVLTARAPSTARTAVSDAAYSVLTTDRLVAYTALTAARTVSLPAASAYPTGVILQVVDESGACSASKTITINRAGSDTIEGATSFVINAPYGALALESNGSNAWTILSPAPNVIASLVGVGTAPDPNNPLSVYGASALFNGTNFNFTINKAASGDTASVIFEDGFSGRAQMGLNGSDNFSFKVSANGSAWTTAIALDATTGVATLANQRTAVSDAAYSALVTDRLIAYTALTAARVVSLPAASAYPPGQALTIADESGVCSATNTIAISRAGSDAINGATTATISTAYAFLALESNGSNAWTIIDQSTLSMAQQAASAVAITGGTINGTAIGGATPAAGAFTTLSLARHAVADANYSVGSGISTVAYASITAARTVTLPAANSFAAGQLLTILDESGSCSATNAITVTRAGSDTIEGATSAVLGAPYARMILESNGSNQWTVVARSSSVVVFSSSGTYTPSPGMTFCDVDIFGGGGGGGGGCLEAASTACSGGGGGGGGGHAYGRFTAAEIGASQTVTIGAAGSAGAAATSNTTAGGNGGGGGETHLGSLLACWGGTGGAGGQLAATGSGGGGGASTVTAGNASGATGGAGAAGGGAGGSATTGTGASTLWGGSGGGGCSTAGAAANGGYSFMASGGGAGGGLTSSSGTNNGGAGGINYFAYNANGSAAGGTAGGSVNGGAGLAPTSGPMQLAGGGGGASDVSAAGHGGAGGTPGGGGGGGGSAENSGSAGAGGAGGAGYCVIVEHF